MNTGITTFKTTINNLWGRCTIEEFTTPISDILVTIYDVSELMFTVKLIDTNEISSINDFKNNLTLAFLRQGAPKIPITIARIDTENNTVELCIAVSWDMNTPTIVKEFVFTHLNNTNAAEFKNNLRIADDTIRMLDIQYCKIVKRISFTYGDTTHQQKGIIIYLREFSSTYKMNMKQSVSERERFERILNGTPEDEFPSDDLDSAILEAIKNKYPDATCRSSILLFNSEFKTLREELNNVWDRQDIQIVFCPSGVQTSPIDWAGVICPQIILDLFTQKTYAQTNNYLLENYYTAHLDYPDKKSFTTDISKNINTIKRVKDIL